MNYKTKEEKSNNEKKHFNFNVIFSIGNWN